MDSTASSYEGINIATEPSYPNSDCESSIITGIPKDGFQNRRKELLDDRDAAARADADRIEEIRTSDASDDRESGSTDAAARDKCASCETRHFDFLQAERGDSLRIRARFGDGGKPGDDANVASSSPVPAWSPAEWPQPSRDGANSSSNKCPRRGTSGGGRPAGGKRAGKDGGF